MDYSRSFPFTSNYVHVLGSNMHYVDEGAGDPMLFLHGIPTSSYLWRKIIPRLASSRSLVAPDLIGMGSSDKPDIPYRIFDHIRYIDAWIDALGLSDITLVVHGWGSVIGLDYARRHPDKIKALAFFESHLCPNFSWDALSLPMQIRAFWLSDKQAQYERIVEENYFLEHFLPKGVLDPLSDEALAYYKVPFREKAHRKLLWQYFCDLPLGGGQPEDVVELIERYAQWLQASDLPKLLVYAVPGFITTIETVDWLRTHWKNLKITCIENALHFAQETRPCAFADALLAWYRDC